MFLVNALRLRGYGGWVLGYDGHLNLHDWLLAYRQILRLTFPSGRMTLAVHIIERLTALYNYTCIYCQHGWAMRSQDDERRFAVATLLTQNNRLRMMKSETSQYCVRNRMASIT